MKLLYTTRVAGRPNEVFDRFDINLFKALATGFPKVDVVEFDCSRVGGKFDIRLNFLLFKQRWIGQVTELFRSENECYFVDEGVKLPFFLGRWRHLHRIVADGPTHSLIIDDIDCSSPVPAFDFLLRPGLHAQFAGRAPKYRRYFGAG